jgi:undecaprenyl diphosphate synthase
MTQSRKIPYHTAIIMDGNGRWALERGLPRFAGHRAGAEALRRTVQAAPALGIRKLTLYAFSADNWSRPAAEVEVLMELLAHHLRAEAEECVSEGVRISLIGRRDRLPGAVLEAAAYAEDLTSHGETLDLRLAIDYSAREAILSAARDGREATRENFSRKFGDDVDLLIRTGGEQRLSDFLLWESAYAELFFTERMWPDFEAADLEAAVAAFASRDRRFGGVTPGHAPATLAPASLGPASLGPASLGPASLGQSWIHNANGTVPELRRDRWLR